MDLKGIFWDNDGVLVDTEALYFQACADTLGRFGIELSREAFVEISLRRGESVLKLARDRAEEAHLRNLRNELYENLLSSRDLVLPGVREVLASLHGKVLMAVVTSSLRSHFHCIHRSSGLLPYFDFVLTREDYHRSKPDPEPYLAALQKSALDPSECLVVEDSHRGLQSALRAGLRCCIIPSDLTAGGDFSGAECLLSGIDEIPALILSE